MCVESVEGEIGRTNLDCGDNRANWVGFVLREGQYNSYRYLVGCWNAEAEAHKAARHEMLVTDDKQTVWWFELSSSRLYEEQAVKDPSHRTKVGSVMMKFHIEHAGWLGQSLQVENGV